MIAWAVGVVGGVLGLAGALEVWRRDAAVHPERVAPLGRALDLEVVENAEGYGQALAGVRFGLPLGAIARRLDDAVRGWDIPPVMGTLLNVSEDSFTLLHRGGPMPLLVSEYFLHACPMYRCAVPGPAPAAAAVPASVPYRPE